MESSAAARGTFRAKRAPSARAPGGRHAGTAPAPPMHARGAGIGPLERLQDKERKADVPPAALAKGKQGRRRNQRPLFRAEQVMEKKKQPKKKYLATQRLRRDLERSQLESLALDVNFLKQEIADLETVRDILQATRLTNKITSVCNLMAIVHEYFHRIQYGYGRETPASAITLAQKIDFLRAVFDENLEFGTGGRGLDNFIAQCQGYTLFHAFYYYEPPTLTQVSPKSEDHSIIIAARNRLRVRVSRQTIEVMFPHILKDEVMVQALIGRELVYPCEITVYFDKRGRVVRHDAIVDFVSGLTAALSSLQQVSRVMDSARLHGSMIVYNRSRPHTKNPPQSSHAEHHRPPDIVASAKDQQNQYFAEDEEKCPAQSHHEPSPVRTPTLSGGFLDDIDIQQFYSSPSPTHAYYAVPSSSEFESMPCEQTHASPTNKAAAHPKETVSSRMSINGLLS